MDFWQVRGRIRYISLCTSTDDVTSEVASVLAKYVGSPVIMSSGTLNMSNPIICGSYHVLSEYSVPYEILLHFKISFKYFSHENFMLVSQ